MTAASRAKSTPEDPDLIVVLGVQRTGSTWLRTLLEQNVDGDVHVQRGHSPGHDPDADAVFVIMRDPWAWLVSFYKFQLHPVHGFLDRWWNRILHPPVDQYRAYRWWNYYLLSYESWERTLSGEMSTWVHYEDLLPDPGPRLAEALDEVGVPRRDTVEDEDRYQKDFSSPLSKILSPEKLGSSSFDPSYYTEKRYLDEYRGSHMRTLLEMANKRGLAQRFERFGYDLAEDVPPGDED